MSRVPEPYPEVGRRSSAGRWRGRAERRSPAGNKREAERQRLQSLPEVPLPVEATGARRILNLGVAAAGLLVALPLLGLIAAAVKFTSQGPVIYAQTRVGRDRRRSSPPYLGDQRRVDLGGKPFEILKFRTMYFRAESCSRQVWTRQNDRRITPVGSFLRAFRLDELPQLVNVLRGEMNLVGPRPEQPEIFARLRERLERYPARQRVLPGITGLAQVRCGYGGSTDAARQKLERDLEYIGRCCVLMDLRIMLWTVPVVLLRRGSR